MLESNEKYSSKSKDNRLDFSAEYLSINYISIFLILLIIFIPFFSKTIFAQQVEFTIVLEDSWGDGWNGASLDVKVADDTVLDGITVDSSTVSYNFNVSDGDQVEIIFNSGNYDWECSYTVYDNNGSEVISEASSPSASKNFTVNLGGSVPEEPVGSLTNLILDKGFESGSIPDKWSQEEVSDNHQWTVRTGGEDFLGKEPASANSGTYNAGFVNAGDGDKTKLLTSKLDLSNFNEPTISFWHAQVASIGQDILRLYYKNSADGNWTLLEEWTEEVDKWTQEIISLPEASGDYYIAFEAEYDVGMGVVLDDVKVGDASGTDEPSPKNPLPADNQKNVSVSSTILSWDEVEGAEEYIISIGTESGQTDVIESITLYSNQYTHDSDWFPNFQYYWKVTAVVDGENYEGLEWSFETGGSASAVEISSLSDLRILSENESLWDPGYEFIQTADIDASDTINWNDGKGFNPIGNDDGLNQFYGKYDGQGHTIDGLFIDRPFEDYEDPGPVGLFGYASKPSAGQGYIKNLNLSNVDINGYENVGGLVGKMEADYIVENCSTSGIVKGEQFVGGLVGTNQAADIRRSYSEADVTGISMGETGGLVGWNYSGYIFDSYSIGDVTRIEESFNYDTFGAFCGSNSGVIKRCYAAGNVYSDDGVDWNEDDKADRGFLGENDMGDVQDNFFDSEAANQDSAIGAAPLTTSQMRDYNSFTDVSSTAVVLISAWDFIGNKNNDSGSNDYWDIDQNENINNGYPILSWQDGADNNIINNVKPEINYLSIESNNENNTELAKAGDKIILTFEADEDLKEPNISISGSQAEIVDDGDNDLSTWQAEYTMQSGDAEGEVSFTVDYEDTAGNAGTQVTETTDDSSVLFISTAPKDYSIDSKSIIFTEDSGLSFDIKNVESGAIYICRILDESGGEIILSDEVKSETQTITAAEAELNKLVLENWRIEVKIEDQAGNVGEKESYTIKRPEIKAEITAEYDGKSLNPGEEITYRLIIKNSSAGSLKETAVSAPIPAGTEYVQNSTKVNGKAVDDINNNLPLLGGFNLSSLENESGILENGEDIGLSYKVKIMDDLISGTEIINQAAVNGEDQVSYPLSEKLSDDPRTSQIGDPLKLMLGDSAVLEIEKEITKLNDNLESSSNINTNDSSTAEKKAINPGDSLEIKSVIKNIGRETALAVKLSDLTSENAELIEGSIEVIEQTAAEEKAALNIIRSAFENYFNNKVKAADNNYQIDGNKLIFALGNLDVGAEITIKYQVKVASEAAEGEIISSESDLSSENSSHLKESKEVTVGSSPVIKAEIEINDINGGEIKVGDELEYTFRAENIGVNKAYNLILKSSHPEGLNYVEKSTKINGRKNKDIQKSSELLNGIEFEKLEAGEEIEIKYRAEVNSAEKLTVKMNYSASEEKNGDSQLNKKVGVSHDPLNGTVEKSITAGVLGTQAEIILKLNSQILDDFSGWYLDILNDEGEKIYSEQQINNSSETEALSLPSSAVNYTALIKNKEKTVFAKIEIRAADISDGDLTIKSEDIDPEGIIYNSLSREIVVGARVYLLDEDGNQVDPSLMEAGQQGQITDNSGSYQFILKEEGKYQILVEKDDYAAGPSQLITPASDNYIRPAEIADADSTDSDIQVVDYSRAPKLNETAVYYLKFDLQSGDSDVLNNHIPVDPLEEKLLNITKKASKNKAVIGELISYEITIKNDGGSSIKDFTLYDKLPNFFKYVADSAVIIKENSKETVEAAGDRILSWDILEIKPKESLTYRYTLVVGSGVQSGNEYLNQAYLKKANSIISNTAEASVLVTADPLFNFSTIIGKVYNDVNQNGIQDAGEKGIAGVEIASISGEISEVDEAGKYHLVVNPESINKAGETIVLKIKTETLPKRAEVISNNPLILKIQPGLINKANFRVKLKD